jgi:hypothetical protein
MTLLLELNFCVAKFSRQFFLMLIICCLIPKFLCYTCRIWIKLLLLWVSLKYLTIIQVIQEVNRYRLLGNSFNQVPFHNVFVEDNHHYTKFQC